MTTSIEKSNICYLFERFCYLFVTFLGNLKVYDFHVDLQFVTFVTFFLI
nr:MAG TPA: hypothetical protein [Caudoviricetes sp.]